MRVTANTFPDSLLNHLNSLNTRLARLQTQAATGQTVRLPEDDPVAMRRVLDMQAEGRTLSQYQRNIARHQELAAEGFNSLKSLKKISDRVREIATAVDDLKSPEEMAIYATEVTELIKQAAQTVNARNRGDYLFAGTATNQPPFVLATGAGGVVTSVTYQGNTTLPESEINFGITLTAQMAGANTTGAGPRGLVADSRVGADFFNHLIAFQDHLLAGDKAAIVATDRAALAQDEDNFLYHIGTNGAIQSRLEVTTALARERTETLEGLVSNEADADLAQTIVRLTQTQTAYEAALQSGGRILGSSLLDFLR
jgi:flagellar hook-associated protein 3 FlgL